MLIGITVIISLLVIFPYIHFFKASTISLKGEDWGYFGSYVGGLLNPAIAILALCALIANINLQSKFSKKQNFEATFFKMMELHNEVINLITYDFNDSEVTGRKAITRICIKFKTDFFRESDLFTATDEVKKEAYNKFYEKYGHEIGHYYRVIYNILKFVDRSKFTYEEKKIYTDLLRAQLSKDELYLLFHNVLYFTGKGEGEMYKWMIRYNILKHLEDEMSGKSDFAKLNDIYNHYRKFRKDNTK